MDIPGQTVSGNLSATATGDITQIGSLTVTGTSAIDANSSAITLIDAGNDFQSAVSLSGGGTQITNAGDLILGSVNVGSFTANSSGQIILTGDVTTTGAQTYNATGGLLLDTDVTLTSGNLGHMTIGAIATAGHGLTVNAGGASTVSGVISGSGAVTYTGFGGITLLGDNTYTGGTTIVEGAVIVGNGGTSGSLLGNVTACTATANCGINFDRSDNITFGGNISGMGYLAQQGAGTLTLTGNNTYSAYTAIVQGTLAIGSASNLGAGDIKIYSGQLQFGASFALAQNFQLSGGGIDTNGNVDVLSGVLSTMPGTNVAGGFGGLNKFGAGTLILTGSNSYVSGTTIAAGVLQIGNGGTTGSLGSGAITDGGTLAFDRSDAVTFTEVISGSGSVEQRGAGTLTLSGNNTYTGGTTVESGTLRMANIDAIADGTPLIVNGGVLDLNGFTKMFAAVSGTGGAINLNGGSLTSDSTSDTTLASVVGGTGTLTKAGSGTLTLAADNTYDGGTTINAGAALQLGSGGTTGSVAGGIVDNGTLKFDRSDAVTIANTISGAGGVEQVGANIVTLSSTSTYTGNTLIMSGALNVTGSIASSAVTVNSDATLMGQGTVGATTVNAGGVVSPGGNNAIATLNVHGNLTLASGSVYDANVTPTTADLLAVSGGADLSGVLHINVGSGVYTVDDTVKLISADGGVSGTFSSFSLGGAFSSAVRPVLVYDANDLFLAFAPNTISPSLPASATANEKIVASNIDALLLANKGDAFTPLFNLSSADLLHTLDQLSGEIATTGQQAGMDLSAQFLNLMIDPFLDARGGMSGATGPALAFAPKQQQGFHVSLAMTQGPLRINFGDHLAANAAANDNPTGTITASAVGGPLGVWVSGYGNVSTADGNAAAGSHDTHANNVGVAAGFDLRASDNFVIGVAGGSARLNYHTSDSLGRGKANVSQGGFYMSDRFATNAYLSLATAYSNYNTRTDRTVDMSSVTSRYTARFNAHDFGMRLEGGKTLGDMDDIDVTPYGALATNRYSTPAHTEKTVSGSSAYALDYDSDTRSETKSELGLKLDTAPQADHLFFVHASAAWQHNFSPTSNVATAAFAGLGGPDFTVQGAPSAKNAALVSLGVDAALAGGFSIGLKGNGMFSSRTRAYGGTGAIQYRW